jgi:hypothetical protein
MGVGWFDYAVMYPLALASGSHQTRPAKISKMTRDFGLADIQHLNVKAHAYLVVADEVDQTQARAVCQSLKKQLNVVFLLVFFACHFGLFC